MGAYFFVNDYGNKNLYVFLEKILTAFFYDIVF